MPYDALLRREVSFVARKGCVYNRLELQDFGRAPVECNMVVNLL